MSDLLDSFSGQRVQSNVRGPMAGRGFGGTISGFTPPMYVVPILGQSNAVGRAGLDGLPYHPAGVLQYDQAGALVAPTTPLDHRITTYSD
ncbi:MAG: hypothetical protein ACRBB0_26930, partial [Pelagimonas sp.]|uniref:hypothetical protein n=1 Tax=Pelagimonas sp. TaxID=2073170 RepID=UPI003D6B1188